MYACMQTVGQHICHVQKVLAQELLLLGVSKVVWPHAWTTWIVTHNAIPPHQVILEAVLHNMVHGDLGKSRRRDPFRKTVNSAQSLFHTIFLVYALTCIVSSNYPPCTSQQPNCCWCTVPLPHPTSLQPCFHRWYVWHRTHVNSYDPDSRPHAPHDGHTTRDNTAGPFARSLVALVLAPHPAVQAMRCWHKRECSTGTITPHEASTGLLRPHSPRRARCLSGRQPPAAWACPPPHVAPAARAS